MKRREFVRYGIAGTALGLMPSIAAGQAQGGGLLVRQGFADCRFGQVHYRLTARPAKGARLPLVCLHASPGSSMSYASFIPLMAQDRQVIAPDTPGYGLSDAPPKPSTIADFAGAMLDTFDSLGLKQIDLLGNHTSSATALEIALQRPGLVRRIVLNSALMYTPEEVARMQGEGSAAAIPSLDDAADKLPQGWRLFRNARKDMSDDDAWSFFWEANRNPLRRAWGYNASFLYDFAGALPRVTQPMLVISPDDVLRAPSLRARGKMQNGQVMEVPWKQGTFGEHAGEVAAIMRTFLDRPKV